MTVIIETKKLGWTTCKCSRSMSCTYHTRAMWIEY